MGKARAWMGLVVGAIVGGASSASADSLGEARRQVESAAVAVGASSRPHGEDAERRAYALARAGHELLGPGYTPAEASAILQRMFLWLATGEGRRLAARLSSSRGLLETAARQAHPAIGDGAGSRGAAQWARFVEKAAGLSSSEPGDAVASK